MPIVTMSCWCSTKNGEWNPRALQITFNTKTPLSVFFYTDTAVAYSFDGNLVCCDPSNFPRRYYRELISGMNTPKHVGTPTGLSMSLAPLVNRLFTPPDLDVDTPPWIVADWLQDRGLVEAANAVRNATKITS